MRFLDMVIRKRDGAELDTGEIRYLVDAYVDGTIPEYQMSSFLMAVCIRGMNFRETADLTRCMRDSGLTVDFPGAGPEFVDKHSTGGVGDKISLILAPMAAACGLKVPMMSGRSLGHTGGTLDKLDSIPGYRTRLTVQEFRSILADCGFAMTGQTADIAPADRKMYSLRDASGTVESIPLITASILSKKCAEGARGLVFDVKAGTGAFMKDPDSARTLARSLVRTARLLGVEARALITGMDAPLGCMVGNFLEVEESWRCLQPGGDGLWKYADRRFTGPSAAVMELSVALTAHMLVMGGLVPDVEAGQTRALQSLEDGTVLQKFCRNLELQGGRMDDFLARIGTFRAPVEGMVRAPADGWIASWDAMAFGQAGLRIGVGRNRTDDEVRFDTGMELLHAPGDRVGAGEGLCRVFAPDRSSLDEAMGLLAEGLVVQKDMAPARSIVEEVVLD